MKTIILIIGLSLINGLSKAQKIKDSEVPLVVKDAVAKQFPYSKVVEWEKENGNYEAELKDNSRTMSVVYDSNGKLVETETEILVSELPAEVQNYIKNSLGGKKAKEASLIKLATGKINYEAEVDGVDYIFDEDGKLLKKEADKEKDDDK